MYDVLVLNENARPRRSLASPIRAFLASSAANNGVSAEASNVPILSNEAGNQTYYKDSVFIISSLPVNGSIKV